MSNRKMSKSENVNRETPKIEKSNEKNSKEVKVESEMSKSQISIMKFFIL